MFTTLLRWEAICNTFNESIAKERYICNLSKFTTYIITQPIAILSMTVYILKLQF